MRLITRDVLWKIFFTIVLFIIPFVIRLTAWLFFKQYLHIYDVHIYIPVGKRYFSGFLKGDISSFAENPEHPPLAKFILGAGVYLLGPLIGEAESAITILSIISTITCVILYYIGLNYGKRTAWIAWAVASIDPFSINWTMAFLDAPLNMFLVALVYIIFNKFLKSDIKLRNEVAAGLLSGAALLCKYTAIIYFLTLIVFIRVNLKTVFKLLVIAVITFFAFNPQMWSFHIIQSTVATHLKFSDYLPAIFYGPIAIGYPFTYPWYILTYLGMGWMGFNSIIFVTPLIVFILFMYRILASKSQVYDRYALRWSAATIVSVALIPRNYWIPYGLISGNVLTRAFYPYYFLLTVPSLALFLATMISGEYFRAMGRNILDKASLGILAFSTALSPLAVLSQIILPQFWDFIFTLLINLHKNVLPFETFSALTLTVIGLIYSIIFAIIVVNKKGR